MENFGEENATLPPRIEKHIELKEAINSIRTVIHALNRLAEKISGPTPKEEAKNSPEPPPPSLADLLNDGPNEISEMVGNAKSIISEIENQIF